MAIPVISLLVKYTLEILENDSVLQLRIRHV